MPPLEPALNDYWTQNRLTQISWEKSCFSGAGLSLNIWSQLFDFSDGSWFACVQGPYNDNLILVSVSSAIIDSIPTVVPFSLSEDAKEDGNISPLAGALGFYELNPDLLKILGAASPEDIKLSDTVEAIVHTHDNFIFQIRSNSPQLDHDALRLTLRVHQHYLAQDLCFTQETLLLKKIIGKLHQEKTITLESHPRSQEISIHINKLRKGLFNRLLGRRIKSEYRLSTAPQP